MKLQYKLPAFEELSENEVLSIYKIADIKKFKKDDIIMKEGDEDQTFFAILEGSVDVFKTLDGRQTKIATLMNGDWVGEIALVDDKPRMASVAANRPSVLMAIKPEDFNTLPVKIKLHLHRHLYDIANRRINRMEGRNVDSQEKFDKLGQYISKIKSKSDTVIASNLIQNIISKIPRLPRYAGDLAIKLLDEGSSAIDVAESIKTDPSLSSLVLKSINSPYYGMPEKVSDLYRAFLLLGFNQVYQLVLDSGIKKTMPNTVEFHELQMHSYVVSILANEVSSICSRKDSGSTSSTIGLLHDIGKSVVLILRKQNPNIRDLLDLLDDSKLGAVLLESWELPELVCKVIELQSVPEYQNPDLLPPDIRSELSILYISHCCADQLMGLAVEDPPGIYFKEYMSYLKIHSTSCQKLVNDRLLPMLERNQRQYPESIRIVIRAARTTNK